MLRRLVRQVLHHEATDASAAARTSVLMIPNPTASGWYCMCASNAPADALDVRSLSLISFRGLSLRAQVRGGRAPQIAASLEDGNMNDLLLTNQSMSLCLRPASGGAVTAFAWHGMAIFRPAAKAIVDPLHTAMFPIAPFANRIERGAFSFGGRCTTLSPNFGDSPHALHGQAWLAPWRVECASNARARLSFHYAQGEWPWAYRCIAEFELLTAGARFSLSIENLSSEAMPVSFGFHPYFANRRRSILTAKVEQMWATDETLIPTKLTPPLLALRDGAPLAQAPFIDNCFTGWDGRARIDRPELSIQMDASPVFGFFHLYAPHEGDHFCAEPVSAMPDALNRVHVEANGLRVLASGEKVEGEMRISVSAPPTM